MLTQGQIHQVSILNSPEKNHDTGNTNPDSSTGHITPIGIQKPLMTDRNWNNSELRKFSVTHSKSNADIADELRRFRVENGVLEDSINNTNHEGGLKIAHHMG